MVSVVCNPQKLSCPLCQGLDHEFVSDKVWSLESGKVFRCRVCDLTFIDPVMNDEEEKEFYRNYSKHVVARGAVATEDPAELHRKAQAASIGRLEKIRAYFGHSQRILEVGASTGAFLELLEGDDRFGVEPADAHRKFLERFCQKVYSDLSEVPEAPAFDIICMFHVFEHIRKPLPFLHECSRRLKKGGKIIIEVPHINDPLLKLYNCAAFKEFYFQPMHPYVYSCSSLEHVFTNAGLKIEGFIYYQRYGLDNHLTWLTKGKPGCDPVFTSVFSDQTVYKAQLEHARITDTIFCVATQ